MHCFSTGNENKEETLIRMIISQWCNNGDLAILSLNTSCPGKYPGSHHFHTDYIMKNESNDSGLAATGFSCAEKLINGH